MKKLNHLFAALIILLVNNSMAIAKRSSDEKAEEMANRIDELEYRINKRLTYANQYGAEENQLKLNELFRKLEKKEKELKDFLNIQKAENGFNGLNIENQHFAPPPVADISNENVGVSNPESLIAPDVNQVSGNNSEPFMEPDVNLALDHNHAPAEQSAPSSEILIAPDKNLVLDHNHAPAEQSVPSSEILIAPDKNLVLDHNHAPAEQPAPSSEILMAPDKNLVLANKPQPLMAPDINLVLANKSQPLMAPDINLVLANKSGNPLKGLKNIETRDTKNLNAKPKQTFQEELAEKIRQRWKSMNVPQEEDSDDEDNSDKNLVLDHNYAPAEQSAPSSEILMAPDKNLVLANKPQPLMAPDINLVLANKSQPLMAPDINLVLANKPQPLMAPDINLVLANKSGNPLKGLKNIETRDTKNLNAKPEIKVAAEASAKQPYHEQLFEAINRRREAMRRQQELRRQQEQNSEDENNSDNDE